MLSRTLSRLIRIGRLTVTGLGHQPRVFGRLIPGAPELDIAVRLAGRATAWKIALRPTLYLGEAYMDGSLTMEKGSIWDLLDLCGRNMDHAGWQPPRGRLMVAAQRLARIGQQMNSRRPARRNVAHHYDLSDVLFRHFLDRERYYSCAYFSDSALSLEQAQAAKVRHIISKLLLKPGMRVLDIGCGWGGLALAIAEVSGASVTGVTLSQEQAAIARQRVAEAGLGGRISIELKDYRDLTGPFDRIVSVGMFEHVGAPHYPAFFAKLSDLLKEDGVALLHSIGRRDGPGMTGSWIRKYIFPGGYVPALSETLQALERHRFWVTDIEVLRLHYAATLRHWRERFLKNASLIQEIYDERFCRMWEFYLASCEMGFRYGDLMVFQMQLAKRIEAVPITRDYMIDAERRSMATAAKALQISRTAASDA